MVRNKTVNKDVLIAIQNLAIALPARGDKRRQALMQAWYAMDRIYFAVLHRD